MKLQRGCVSQFVLLNPGSTAEGQAFQRQIHPANPECKVTVQLHNTQNKPCAWT